MKKKNIDKTALELWTSLSFRLNSWIADLKQVVKNKVWTFLLLKHC